MGTRPKRRPDFRVFKMRDIVLLNYLKMDFGFLEIGNG
jgi:hypothetical protein